MSSKNLENPNQKTTNRTSFVKSKKRHNKKNYFNSSAKKYQFDEKEISSPNKIIYKPKIIESPDQEDEYKNLIYQAPVYNSNNLENVNYYNEKRNRDELNNYRTKWKTEMCKYWEMYGKCKYGNNCAFAHGESELNKRKLSFNYKTKPCKQFFELGYCSYGIRCQFSHKNTDYIRQKKLSDGDIINDNNNKVSYLKIIKEFLADNNKEISHELIIRPRLKTFENITSCTLQESVNNRLKLYEDIINIKNEKIYKYEKQEKHPKMKNSEDSYYTNFSSDNNEKD
jgi:hypothetical protein